jgi:hypothetical protein
LASVAVRVAPLLLLLVSTARAGATLDAGLLREIPEEARFMTREDAVLEEPR